MKNLEVLHKSGSLFFAVVVGLTVLAMSYSDSESKKIFENQNQIMESLDSYVGKWKSDTKTNQQNGSKFHFEYDLSYFNPDKTIMKMVITQHFEDGKESLWWEGYKGWNPVKEEVYYYGFSPSGRFSVGTVSIEDKKLVTRYTGYGPDGAPVQIVDEFYPVEKGTFKSVTNLKPEGGDWRVIGKDEWTKI